MVDSNGIYTLIHQTYTTDKENSFIAEHKPAAVAAVRLAAMILFEIISAHGRARVHFILMNFSDVRR